MTGESESPEPGAETPAVRPDEDAACRDGAFDGEPVDANAITWGDPEAIAGAATLGGLPGLDDPLQPLPNVDGYDLLRELERGGMGVVYLARNRELDRLCALKMILAGNLAGSEAIRRFLTEAGTVARLKHAGIVQVYHCGQHDGRPFLELEYLDGGALTTMLNGTPWEPQRAAALMHPVAEAVAEAHRQRIVHRDLKPGNILLDANGQPKVSDFGIAKSMGMVTGLTEAGQILGSPWYMAPEQAHGHTREVGAPADVHALGAVLYELLTGRPPFQAATVLDTLEQVRSSTPVGPRRLVPSVPKDLDTITLHCLEKHPEARYPDAGALAEDLARFLRDEPVRARPIGPHVRFGRWCGRNPLLAALEGAVIGLLVLTTLVTWILYLRVARAARDEQQHSARLEDQVETTQFALEESQANGTALLAAQRALDRALYASRTNLAQAAYEAGDLPRVRHLLDLLAPRPEASAPQRGWEYHYLRRIGHEARPCQPLILSEPDQAPWLALAVSSDSRFLLTGLDASGLHGWDLTVNPPLRRQEPMTSAPSSRPLAMAVSTDGTRLASVGEDREITLWDAQRLVPLASWPTALRAPIRALAFAPDGNTLAGAGDDGQVARWDSTTGTVRATHSESSGGPVVLVFAPDGTQIALGTRDGAVRLLDARNGTRMRTLRGHDGPVHAVAYAPDGTRFVSAGEEGWIQVWDPNTGEMIATLTAHTGALRCVVFHPSGARLASAGDDRTVKLWDLVSGQELLTLNGPRAAVSRLSFTPDGHRLTAASLDGAIRVWDATPTR